MTEAVRVEERYAARRVDRREVAQLRRLARAVPAGLMVYDSSGQLNAPPHITFLNDVLVDFMRDVRAQKDPRVILSFPPRHGKTTLAGNYFPAWSMGNWPELRFIYGSYGGDFSAAQGRKVRDILDAHGKRGDGLWDVEVRADQSAANNWATTAGGTFLAVGAGTGVTGYGADVFLFDDLVKDAVEARSVAVMETRWDWLRAVARTRVQPGGGAFIIGTRWSKADPIGRLIEAQRQPDWDGDVYRVINVPALAEADDPLGRKPGEALAPMWGWTTQRLARLKGTIGSIWFGALYMGNPIPDQGILFNRADFRYYSVEGDGRARVLVLTDDPATGKERRFRFEDCSVVSFMDPAATESELSAYTAITVWAITPEADLVLLDVLRQKVETTKHAALMDSARARWGRDLLIVVEKGAYGFHAIQEQKRLGKNIRPVRAEKDKVARARVAEARYTVHKVFHPREAGWLAAFEGELLEFPLGQFKDQVDTTAYACAWTAYGDYLDDPEDNASLTDVLNRIF